MARVRASTSCASTSCRRRRASDGEAGGSGLGPRDLARRAHGRMGSGRCSGVLPNEGTRPSRRGRKADARRSTGGAAVAKSTEAAGLIAAWRTNDRATVFLVQHLPRTLWSRQVPGIPRLLCRARGPPPRPTVHDRASTRAAAAVQCRRRGLAMDETLPRMTGTPAETRDPPGGGPTRRLLASLVCDGSRPPRRRRLVVPVDSGHVPEHGGQPAGSRRRPELHRLLTGIGGYSPGGRIPPDWRRP
jgi:hypothetical protein